MKLIKPSFLIKEQEENLEGIYKQIEWAGRHCYKSENKITETSAKEFVDRMIKSVHDELFFVTTNYRVLIENNKLSDLEFLCKPNETILRFIKIYQ